MLATQTLPLKPFKTMAINVDRARRAAPRRHGEGHHPRRHRQDRHRRRPGLRAGVPRQRHPSALDGGPDDDLQHVDRGGRPGRHDRAGRDDLRLPERPRTRPTGADWDAAVADWRDAAHRRRRGVRRRGRHRRGHADARSSPGAPTRARALPLRRAVPDPADRRRQRARRRRAGAGVHGPQAGTPLRDIARRHRLPRLVHQRPDRGPAGRREDHAGPQGRRRRADAGRPRLDAGAARRPRPRASTRSSSTPAPSGAPPAARCAWA